MVLMLEQDQALAQAIESMVRELQAERVSRRIQSLQQLQHARRITSAFRHPSPQFTAASLTFRSTKLHARSFRDLRFRSLVSIVTLSFARPDCRKKLMADALLTLSSGMAPDPRCAGGSMSPAHDPAIGEGPIATATAAAAGSPVADGV